MGQHISGAPQTSLIQEEDKLPFGSRLFIATAKKVKGWFIILTVLDLTYFSPHPPKDFLRAFFWTIHSYCGFCPVKLPHHVLFIKEMGLCKPVKWITVKPSPTEDNVLPSVTLVHLEGLFGRFQIQILTQKNK